MSVKTGKSTGGVVRCEDVWVELGRRSEVRAEVTQSNLQHSENKNGLALCNETHRLPQIIVLLQNRLGGGDLFAQLAVHVVAEYCTKLFLPFLPWICYGTAWNTSSFH